MHNHSYLLIAGDFNSHLSSSSLSPDEAQLIGKYAGHENFNENGLQMKLFIRLHTLAVRSTQFNSNDSFRWTWSNGNLRSQVDHFLTALRSCLFLRRLQCVVPGTCHTDHKLLLCNIVVSDIVPSPTLDQSTSSRSTLSKRSKLAVDPSQLKKPDVQRRFQSRLCEAIPSTVPPVSIEDTWSRLK